jgi:hypothetical protein
MASPPDPFENVRRMPAEPAVLRQIREMTEFSRRLSGLGVASNLERLNKAVPASSQLRVMNVGTDVTRMLAGSSAVTAWAEAQNVHRKLAELMKPKVLVGFETPAVLTQLQGLSDQLTAHTRVLARLRMPNVLEQATADSTRGWRLLVDDLGRRQTELLSTSVGGTFALGTSISARIMRPTLIDEDDEDQDEEAQHPAALVDAIAIGEQYRHQVRAALSALDARLLERWDGAWNRLIVVGPDGPSQAAHSIQELIDWTLRLAAPRDEVLAWHRANGGSPNDLNKDGLPTRDLMVRYILGPRAHDKAGKLFMSSLTKIVGALQQAKHGFEGPTGPAMIRSVLLNTESFLGFLLITDNDEAGGDNGARPPMA